jgi:hypothetical protein
MVTKEQLSKLVMKKPLPRIVVTIEMGVIVFNGHSKTVGTIANNHQTVTKRRMTPRVFSYLSTSTIHVPLASFLSRYVVNIVTCSFLLLLCPLSNSLPFVFSPMLLLFLVIMRGSVSKERKKRS